MPESKGTPIGRCRERTAIDTCCRFVYLLGPSYKVRLCLHAAGAGGRADGGRQRTRGDRAVTRREHPRRWISLLAAGLGGTFLVQGTSLHAQQPLTVETETRLVAAQDGNKLQPPSPRVGGIQMVPQRPPRPEDRDESFLVIRIKTAAPERDELFRLETEQSLRQRVIQETKQTAPSYRGQLFPTLPPRPASVATVPRLAPPINEVVEPYFVCHGRLYFEQPNFERYGWNYGLLQPIISTGLFYSDLIRLPYDWLTNPHRHYDCSAGKCLPGDPVPLIYNPFVSK